MTTNNIKPTKEDKRVTIVLDESDQREVYKAVDSYHKKGIRGVSVSMFLRHLIRHRAKSFAATDIARRKEEL